MTVSRASVWLAVGAGSLIIFLGTGIRHSFGIFLPPITTDLGWGREVYSLGFALQMFLLGFGAPTAGAVADRYGAGRVLAFGSLFQFLGLLGVALTTSPTGFILTAGVLAGLGASAVSNVVVIGAIGRVVEEKRVSRTVGILMGGGSIGQILILPLAHNLIRIYGWSPAMIVMAAMMLAVAPLGLFLVRGQSALRHTRLPQRIGEALSEARRHSGYLLLAAGFFVCGFHVFFLSTHLPAYIQDKGLDAVVGTNAMMFIGFFNMIGVNVWGLLGDWFSKKHMLGLIYGLRAVVITILMLSPVTNATVYLFASVMGFLWLGTIPLTSGLVRQIFGPQYVSMLYGIVFLSHQTGGFLGAWMAGWLFDLTGSYSVMWGLSIGLAVFAALIHQPINERSLGERTATA